MPEARNCLDTAGRSYYYGEFFPNEMSPFAYNESSAQLYFPKSKEEVQAQGLRWRDSVDKKYQITLACADLPNDALFSDSITKEVVGCEHGGQCQDGCTKAFRIVPQEIAFYRKLNLPLPRLYPACRHVSRVSLLNKFRLYKKTCDCSGASSADGVYANKGAHFHGQENCPNIFQTSYAPDRPEIVYCEQCYQNEVV